MALAVGVDGWRRGWVAVALRDGRFESAATGTLAAIVGRYPEAAAIGVDIPIGLPETGLRPCDVAARRLLGPRRSSVFPAPVRAVLGARTYAEARRLQPSLSAQAFRLLPKIAEAAALTDRRVVEVHPELSFWAMAGRHLPAPKRTWAGQADRVALLREQGVRLPGELEGANDVPPDDVLDAAAAAWTAARVAAGRAERVGDEPARIWF